MKRYRPARQTFSPTRRTEVFEGQDRLDELHERYSGGRLVDGERLVSCTWDDHGGVRGIAVFEKVRPATY